jgi:hypothetical protein
MSKQNQCQGCQSQWPVEDHSPWPKGSKTMSFHLVPDGYKGEKAMCTKDRYIDNTPTKD